MNWYGVEQQIEESIESPTNSIGILDPTESTVHTGSTVFVIGAVCILIKLLTELVKACKS
jgi:hypothetical protein